MVFSELPVDRRSYYGTKHQRTVHRLLRILDIRQWNWISAIIRMSADIYVDSFCVLFVQLSACELFLSLFGGFLICINNSHFFVLFTCYQLDLLKPEKRLGRQFLAFYLTLQFLLRQRFWYEWIRLQTHFVSELMNNKWIIIDTIHFELYRYDHVSTILFTSAIINNLNEIIYSRHLGWH